MGDKEKMSLTPFSKIFKITEKIDKILLDSGAFNIESKDFLLKSLEDTLEYSLVALPKPSPKIQQKISFAEIDLRRISIISSPGFSEEMRSVSRIEGELTKGFILDPGKLSENAEEFNFKFGIECEVEPVVKDLVRKDHQVEAVGEEENTYWLHAQIKKLKDLRNSLRKLDLVDIPFVVNVAVHQDVKTKFPTRRQRELELIAKWAHELDRNRKWMLTHEHLRLKRQRPKEKDITGVLSDLQILFMPHRFKSFVDVLKDFHYSDCFRGADFYDQIPFRTFPKWMSIISRTDLSVEKPASEGELVYKKAMFQEAVEKAITKK